VTSQDCRRQKILKLFCPDSKCSVNEPLSCLDPVSNMQRGLVCKRLHTADRTGQNCSVSNILRTTENSLDLSPILFTPLTREDKCRWCERGVTSKHSTWFWLQSQMLKLRHLGNERHFVCWHYFLCERQIFVITVSLELITSYWTVCLQTFSNLTIIGNISVWVNRPQTLVSLQ